MSASPTSSFSRVVGVDTLALPSYGLSDAIHNDPYVTRFKWRGKGWLKVASSRWQILGCSPRLTLASESSGPVDLPWVLTYFDKTLFTSAGLDIYARSPEGLPENLVDEIISKAKALGGDVGRLANTFFKVPTSHSG